MRNLILLLFTALSLFSCSVKSIDSSQELIGFGFVLQEEDCYLIKTETEEFFPENLDEIYKVNGLRIKFNYFISESQPTQNCVNYTPIVVKEIIPYRK